MARATNGLGQFRGKVGSVVFRVSQGQQIASAYQPAVKNPKSNLQTAQRNKMYLASQLSKLVPREDIIGLASRGSARDRRSLFVKNILENAISTYGEGIFSTGLLPMFLKFSQGEDFSNVFTATMPTANSNSVDIMFGGIDIDESVYNRLALKFVQLSVVNGQFSLYKSTWLELPTLNQAENIIQVDIAKTSNGGDVFYLIPVLLNENVRYSAERKTLIQMSEGGEIIIEGEYPTNSAVYQWGNSIYLGNIGGGEIIPPSGDGDEVVNPDGPNFPNIG